MIKVKVCENFRLVQVAKSALQAATLLFYFSTHFAEGRIQALFLKAEAEMRFIQFPAIVKVEHYCLKQKRQTKKICLKKYIFQSFILRLPLFRFPEHAA